MLIPSKRLLWAAGALVGLGLIASIYPELANVWVVAAVMLDGFAAVDALAALQIRPPAALRVLPGSLPLGVAHDVVLRLANPGAAAVTCEVHDHYPAGAEAHGLPQRVTVPARGWAEIR